MLIVLPDPDPGRCKNYRDGRRCLDYDDHDSRCTFPEESDPYGFQVQQSHGWILDSTTPQPWVSPLDEEPS